VFLFKVQHTFAITGRGLILTSDVILGTIRVRIGDKIKIVTPDNKVIEPTVKGIAFANPIDILVDQNVAKDDVPIGSEVWLNKE